MDYHRSEFTNPGSLAVDPACAEARAERRLKLAEVLRSESGIWALAGHADFLSRAKGPSGDFAPKYPGGYRRSGFFKAFEAELARLASGNSALLPSVEGSYRRV